MSILRLSLEQTQRYPSLLTDYLAQKPALDGLYSAFPDIAAFEAQMERKAAFPQAHRQGLQEALQAQYASISCPKLIQENITALTAPSTFVVCTGQQVHPFLGPMYVLFKLLRTIRLSQQLAQAYPNCRFVPLFWMHTEDHDLEEINHVYWQGERHSITLPNRYIAGCLPTEHLAQFSELLPMSAFHKAYVREQTLGAATRLALAELFGDQGLVVLDPQDIRLKVLAAGLFERVLFDPAPLVDALGTTTKALRSMGYVPPLSAHNLRLFYLDKQADCHIERHAIHQEEEFYTPLQRFTPQRMRATVQEHADFFSPAAGIRPLYQELILPNLAYVAGPSELSYWLQLAGVFKSVSLPMPLLVPRLSGTWLQPAQYRWMQKNKLPFDKLFLSPSKVRTCLLGIEPLDISQEQQTLEQLFASLQARIQVYDPSMQGYLGRQHAYIQSLLLRFQQTLLKRLQQKEKQRLHTLAALQQTLFPNGQLQERVLAAIACFTQPDALKQAAEVDAFDFSFYGWLSKPVADAVA